jgi:hypothetical protein
MGALLRLLAVILLTSIGLALFTEYRPGTLTSYTEVLGLPVVSIAQVGAQGWLAFGQAASGVLVIAQAGAGVVALTQVGVSVLFGIGQGMLGLLAIAQIGVGAFFFLGQAGVGAQAAGQGVAVRRPPPWFRDLDEEMTEVLSFGRGR